MSSIAHEDAQSDGDDWDEIEEGVPQMTDPFMQKYIQGRDALISQEKKLRSDNAFRQSLSPAAAEACAIVSRIRAEERRTVWTGAFEESLITQEKADVFPGMMFTLAKDRMQQTRLWKIVEKLPKGSLLHAHLCAMIELDWLFELALSIDGMCISSMTPLTSKADLEMGEVAFQFAKTTNANTRTAGDPDTNAAIWTSDYTPGTLVPLVAAADSFPDGGRAGFLSWLKDRCTITAEESLKHHHGLNAIWRKFISTFAILKSLLFYEPIFRQAIRKMCHQLLSDGVRWVDLREVFMFEYRKEGSEAPLEEFEGYAEMIRVMGEEVEKFKATEEGKGFWGARMIWTTLRHLDRRSVIENMNYCIEAKLMYPELIAGYDLVGQEDMGRTLKDLTPELFWFRKSCAEEGVEIPFFFHAGECLGDGSETDHNLFDAILLGTRRLGHAYSLYKHPLLIDMVKEKKILVESCPISNEVLRLTGSICSHTLPALLARGVPASLCNDDPAILGQGTSGTTHEFWQCLQAWDNLGLEGLAALAENSVRWSPFEDESAADWVKGIKDGTFGKGLRAARLKEWNIEWERFCQWVVEEYGDDAEGAEGGDDAEA
ncbi:adenosine deaminase family protein [Xylona heveae TC161]|uniref:adenosine deaminase n=1 Tax=Xylona heveae (strain CBS 132557 / TC161) TaxID=1328760 RepID=A0A165I3I1_XYLHT|nr:adenosine deaminase family protein [Xylona heveae TC161]KZF24324.1 adenosine deaminase family protein [Xylona heveae TC161]